MSKGPTPRHSKSPDPVTIDLDATDVTPRGETPAAPETPRPSSGNAAANAPASAPGMQKPDAQTAAGNDRPADPQAGAATSSGTSVPGSGSGGGAAGKPSPAAGASSGPKPSGTTPTSPRKDSPGAGFGRNDPSPARPASAMSGGLAAGLVGGLIAAGAIYGLQWGGVLPLPAGSQAGSVTTADLDARLSSLSARVDGLPTGSDSAAAVATLSQRVEAIEQASDESADADAPALTARMDELARRIETITEAGTGTEAGSALAAGFDEVKDQGAANASALQAIDSRLSGIESSLAALESEQAAISGRVAQAEADLARPDANLDVARAIASVGLKAAIDRGGPFTAELDAFASVAADDASVAGLRDFAANGVPTRSQLLAAFPAAADSMIAAMRPDEPDAGVFDRLLSSAMTMVKVRRVGDVEGDSVEAIVARMETRLTDGDLKGALAQWQQLPDPAKAAASAFGDKLAARARVDELLATAVLPSVPAVPAK
ncbi:hypothetical protein DFR52_105241 [Hoeflea marina]|uniref:Inner membrane protein n=1 Tax=Hoeflea marina TaxID=274592 RepID=A0A317PF44_9HYPH|nr:mitofilin family membrane protein [Hoeflea marina]PWV98260.1 hypothetical protein DFR52_105241 [Hoeflea marina]